ncbi:DUF4214 domain-containing protein [Burkholderia sp. LMU1-1-1.1]|uniref:DUF4214 domain-containing protein n=1 Tax=Burkholderia sp. LMU1-1-1.1 TaxID=3135266 RepID=UPI003416ADD6
MVEQNRDAMLAALKTALSTSAEFTSASDGLSNEVVVDQLYVNLYGRHAESASLFFWTGLLQSGKMTLADLILTVADGAQNGDLIAFNSKIAAAEAFTAELDAVAEISGYANPAAAALARAYITAVTDLASLAVALAALPEAVARVTGAPLNNAATGAVIASGTAIEGQTLTAFHTLADADGLGAVSYQWKAAGVAINGATSDTFTLTAAQVGKPITVTAIYTDGLGTRESVTSNVIVSGNDTLKGSAGADLLAGGVGDDTYVVNVAGDVVVENAGEGTDQVNVAYTAAGTHTLAANVENATVTSATIAVNLVGNALDNVLTGNAAANTLTGNAGNDTLDGGAGADKLAGGSGNDTYVVDVAGDAVTELAGEGTDSVRTSLATYTLTANVENLAYTGGAAFTGTGNALDNVITGGNAGNKLDGGAGNDKLIGGNGADNLIGGLGDDTFIGATGKDIVDGGAGADLLQGLGKFSDYTVTRPTATDTVLTDGAGNVITARGVENFAFADGDRTLAQVQDNVPSALNDRLHGTDGNDVLNGGLGVDTLSGGLGDDTYVLLNAADVVLENAGEGLDLVQVALTAAGTYVLAANVEDAIVTAAAAVAVNLTGNELNNALTGNAAANTLTGGAGNDTLDGGAGTDKLTGGSGNDSYVVDVAGDVVTELAGEGADSVRTTLATYALTANVENLAYTGVAAFTGTGNAFDNIITGGNGNNKLDGGAGNDTLTGGAGADSLLGGAGDDSLDGGTGKDTIDGGDGVDVLRVAGNWRELGRAGDYTVGRPNATDTTLTDKAGNVITVRNVENFLFDDHLVTRDALIYNIASVGDDKLYPDPAVENAVLDGGPGADTMEGGGDHNTYIIDNVGDTIVETWGGGIDTARVGLAGAGVVYTLGDNVENGIITSTAAVGLTGNAVGNTLTGNAAANTLTGLDGDDTLDGGAGADKLIGGLGDDVYIVADAGDTVTEALNDGVDSVYASVATYTMTANVENLSYTGSAAFKGTGNAMSNTLTGGDGNDTLDGGADGDRLIGGLGADSLLGGEGDDIFIAGPGRDTVDGGDGIDELRIDGYARDYVATRPNAVDTVLTDKTGHVIVVRNVEQFSFDDMNRSLDDVQYNIVSPGDDKLAGGDGNDTIDGGLGADTMSGGEGDDTYMVDNAGDVIFERISAGIDTALVALTTPGGHVLAENVENGTITSKAAINLTGNDLDNLLTGNAAVNTLTGGAGADTLDGGAGADKLIGGIGDDVYLVADAGDTVTENADEGWDHVRVSVATYTLSANVDVLTYTGTGAFTGTGNGLNNTMVGGNGGNKLDGAGGDDLLRGGTGNDSLSGGLGEDQFQGFFGKDTIDGGDGVDTLVLYGAMDEYTVSRPQGTDVVFTDRNGHSATVRNVENVSTFSGDFTMAQVLFNVASPGADVLGGTDGDDTIDGVAGADTMSGGAGNDTYIIVDKASQIVEQQFMGIDTARVALTTAGAVYTLADNVEAGIITSTAALNLTGNALHNALTGNAAANTLTGGAGNDTLAGGAGNDKLIGGADDDTYVVTEAGDVVTELAGEGDDIVDTTLATYTLAANVETLNYTGKVAFSGTGNALDNAITGGAGNDKLDGGAGNDTLTGGAGHDSLLGGAGNDQFDAGTGKDTIDGGLGIDTVAVGGYSFDYTVTRPNATDTVLTDAGGTALVLRNVEAVSFWDTSFSIAELQYNIATVGNDHLYGHVYDYADLIDGGAGVDTLEGYGGDDTYVIADAASVVLEEAGAGQDLVRVALTKAGTYTLADNVEDATVTAAASIAVNLTGNALDNWLTGNAAANTLLGGAGNDTLDGGLGNDMLRGGAGDDLYHVGQGGDTVTELANEGVDTVVTTLASYTLGAQLEILEYDGTAAFSGTGNAQANLILAGDGGSRLDGGAGDDVLAGGRGNDNLLGGAGNDAFFSGAGKDSVDGGAGSDRLSALDYFGNYTVTRPNATDVLLTHRSGATVIVHDVEFFDFADATLTLEELRENIASPGDDLMHGSLAADTLDGGLGNDTLTGGDGDDSYLLSAPGDVIVEMAGEGLDLAVLDFAAAGTYTMADNVEQVVMTTTAGVAINVVGNALDNYIGGNAGANNLAGGAGNDVLAGGAGIDTLAGGSGDDEYQVAETGDVIVEQAGDGIDHVFSKAAVYTLSANVERLIFDGTGAFTGTGNADANQLFSGSSNAAKLDGGAGNDTLVGGAGNDSLTGGLGDDQLQASGGRDTLDGGAGFDIAYGLGAFSGYKVTRPTATDTVLTDASGVAVTVRGIEHFYFDGVGMTLAQVQNNSGGVGNDIITGTDADDVLDGGVGADFMFGGGGDDIYMVDNVGDVVAEIAGEGLDQARVTLAAGTYVLGANVEQASIMSTGAVNLTGNASNNLLVGNAASNRLTGGEGNDTLDGGAGNDVLAGGLDGDLYLVGETGDVITELADGGYDVVLTTAAAYTLGANVEAMTYVGAGAFTGIGNALENRIDGGDFGNKLDGGAGNDILDGGRGNDSLAGGAGHDQLFASEGADTLDGGAGDDVAQMSGDFSDYMVSRPTATDVVLTDRAGNATTLRNIETVVFIATPMTVELLKVSGNVATTGNDNLYGPGGDNIIDGLAGNDTMAGGAGNDIYVVSAPGDVIVESWLDGTDQVNVGFTAAGTYVLSENVENATVTAAAGIAVNVTGNAEYNVLIGNAAANTLIGGAGNDTLNGGAGADSLVGGDGDDYYVVDAAGDKVVEALDGGTDRVDTSLASHTLAANVENLRYTGAAAFTGTGNALGNTIQSGAGNDVLNGGAGDDVLTGGAGDDKLTGGAGADTFVLNSLAGTDTIADFVSGTDHLAPNLAALAVGNGDLTLDGADTRDAPGGFARGSELVLFSQGAAGAGAANAAAAIGSASAAYAVGETALFAVSTGTATTLYLFKSGDEDAIVSATELTQVAVLTGTPTMTLADFLI